MTILKTIDVMKIVIIGANLATGKMYTIIENMVESVAKYVLVLNVHENATVPIKPITIEIINKITITRKTVPIV